MANIGFKISTEAKLKKAKKIIEDPPLGPEVEYEVLREDGGYILVCGVHMERFRPEELEWLVNEGCYKISESSGHPIWDNSSTSNTSYTNNINITYNSSNNSGGFKGSSAVKNSYKKVKKLQRLKDKNRI